MVASDTPLRTDHSWLKMPALLDAAQICGNVFSAGVNAYLSFGAFLSRMQGKLQL